MNLIHALQRGPLCETPDTVHSAVIRGRCAPSAAIFPENHRDESC